MRCDLAQKLKPKTCFFEKWIWEGFWGKIGQCFRQGTILPPNASYSQLRPEKRYGAGFVKKSRPKTCFLGRTKHRSEALFPQLRHLVRLAMKIGELLFSIKIPTENVFFEKTNSRGLLRQNWAMLSSGTILPPNAPYTELGPEKRYGAGFIKKFQPKMCLLGWTKLHSGTLLPPIVPSSPFGKENRWGAI